MTRIKPKISSAKGDSEADNTAPSTRIRDNQRRSRARRKEYVQDLEQRLRRFERLGVEATHEVQAAGRKVAEENALLRSLLRLHGVTEEEVGEYLNSQRQSGAVSAAIPPVLLPDQRQPRTVGRLSTGGSGHLVRPPLSSSIAIPPEMRHSRLDGSSINDLDPIDSSSPVPVIGHADRPVPLEPDILHQSHDQLDSGLVTSCEDAATIISSIRGYPDPQYARAELGCSSDSNCMAKNMAIFDILDR